MLFDRLSPLVATKNRERLVLITIAAVVFIIQLLALRPVVGIGEPYWIARELAAGHGFIYAYPPFDRTFLPTCFIPPFYVWFHAAIILLGGGLIVSQIAGLIFFHIANYFFYRFFRRITSPGIALAGFLALAFYIPLWILSQTPDPDGLNLLLIALTILYLDDAMQQPRRNIWIGLGILFGIQILVRPDILMGIIFFGIWLVIFSGNKRKQKITGYAISIMIALLMVLPWTIRNYLEFDSFVLVSANSGFNFYMGNNSQATGEFKQSYIPTIESMAMDSANAAYFRQHTSPVDRDAHLYQVGKQWISDHPAEALKLWIKKFYFHWWQREEAGGGIAATEWMVTGYEIVSLFLLIFGFYGLFSLKSKSRKALLITLFLYSTAISVIFFSQSRHRAIKVDPYLVTLSIIGVDAGMKKLRINNSKLK